MAALVCEICGGKLIAKAGGLFECDSCGMQYDKSRIQEMVQEIKGTVKVEGTVEVQGTVRVEGPVKVEGAASAQSLLRRAEIALEDENYKEAEAYFNQVLDSDPECGAAYFGRELAKVCGDMSTVAKSCFAGDTVGIRRARQFADEALAAELSVLDSMIAEEKRRLEEEARKDEKSRALRKSAGAKKAEEYRVKREQAFRAKGMSTGSSFHGWFLDADGKLFCDASDLADLLNKIDFSSQVYCDIVQICEGRRYCKIYNAVICLRADGSVFELRPVRVPVYGEDIYKLERVEIFGEEEKIVQVVSGRYAVCGLRDDGTIACSVYYGEDKKGRFLQNAEYLSGVRRLVVDTGDVFALREDGTAYDIYMGIEFSAEDIVSIANGGGYMVYLHTDGTLSVSGECSEELARLILEWTDVIDISHRVWKVHALFANGTVRVITNTIAELDLEDIVALCDNFGIKSDGTVVDLTSGKPVNEKLKLFNNIRTLKQEQRDASVRRKEKAEKLLRERIAGLTAEKASLESEFANLKGIFSGSRRKQIEARLAEIEKELKGLE